MVNPPRASAGLLRRVAALIATSLLAALAGCASSGACGEPIAAGIGAPSRLTIEILGFADCPHTAETKRNLERALVDLSIAAEVIYVDQATLPSSDARRHWPAPTILVRGKDLFGLAPSASAALRCRTYVHGAPQVNKIASALAAFTHSK